MERMLHIHNDKTTDKFFDKVENSDSLSKISSIVGLDKIGRWYEIVTSRPLNQTEMEAIQQVFPNFFFEGHPVRVVTCDSYGEICSIQARSAKAM